MCVPRDMRTDTLLLINRTSCALYKRSLRLLNTYIPLITHLFSDIKICKLDTYELVFARVTYIFG